MMLNNYTKIVLKSGKDQALKRFHPWIFSGALKKMYGSVSEGDLVVVYSKQVDRGIAPADYFFSLQRQILADISGRSDLRLAILNVIEETGNDGNFSMIDDFINGKVPNAFGYSLRVCDLGDEIDFCKMNADTYVATRDRDVFVPVIPSGVTSSYIGRRVRYESRLDSLIGVS